MSFETEVLDVTKSSDRPLEPLSWHQTWILALTRPSVASYERIIQDPLASARRAYMWIFGAVITGTIIQAIVTLPGLVSDLGSLVIQGLYSPPGIAANAKDVLMPYTGMIVAPAIALVQIPALLAVVALRQWIAGRFLGGTGTYASLVYATAAYWAPIYILSIMLSAAPYLICLGFAFWIYPCCWMSWQLRQSIALAGEGQPFLSSACTLWHFSLSVCWQCADLIILGPQINNIFQNNIRELESAGVAPWYLWAFFGAPWLTV